MGHPFSDRMRYHRLLFKWQAYMALLLGPLPWPPLISDRGLLGPLTNTALGVGASLEKIHTQCTYNLRKALSWVRLAVKKCIYLY